MQFPVATVAVFEGNKTRAELYGLWLDEHEVRVASSKRMAQESLIETAGVAVINEGFADGAAETLAEIIKAECRACRILAIGPRNATFPEFDADNRLTKPVFEEELRENVGALLTQLNYQVGLQSYYRITLSLSARERADRGADDSTEELEQLREQATALEARLKQYREQLSAEEVAAVKRRLTLAGKPHGSKETVDSKYRPDECSNCSEQWDEDEEPDSLKRIAAYVWRCTNCGSVLMENDPSHRQTIYRH